MSVEPGPRVGCGAAVLRDGALLLVRRRREPEAGCWGLPGGKVDPFETVADAIRREVSEELGIAVELGPLLCVVDQIDEAAGSHWIAPVHLVTVFSGVPAVREPEALSDATWFALNALPSPMTAATWQAVAALKEGTADGPTRRHGPDMLSPAVGPA